MNYIFLKCDASPTGTCMYTGKDFQKHPSEKETVDGWATPFEI